MKKDVIKSQNRDVFVSYIYAMSNQPDMSIHEQRIILRILELCQIKALQGVTIKDYTGEDAPRFVHGQWDVLVKLHVSDVFFSNLQHKEIIKTLDNLSRRFFTYYDGNVWSSCAYIIKPTYILGSGIITFRVDNDLWNVLTMFSKGYRKFELNKALALPTSYAVRFYILLCNQDKKPIYKTVDELKDWLGIASDLYRTKEGADRIDNLENRILKPIKKALDESCPWTFNYTKKRENENSIRSRVIGFNIIPKRQLKYRDTDLERKELQPKISTSFMIDSHINDCLKWQLGFTSDEINRHKALFFEAQKVRPDLLYDLSILKGKSRTADNPKGYIINAIKSMVKEAQNSLHV